MGMMLDWSRGSSSWIILPTFLDFWRAVCSHRALNLGLSLMLHRMESSDQPISYFRFAIYSLLLYPSYFSNSCSYCNSSCCCLWLWL